MSPKLWVVVTGGILGIVAMRLVVGQLIGLVQRYPALVDGAFVIIAWVGLKLCWEYLHDAGYVHLEIPQWFSLRSSSSSSRCPTSTRGRRDRSRPVRRSRRREHILEEEGEAIAASDGNVEK